MQHFEYIVVGAGPVGLIAAHALSQISTSILLVGPSSPPLGLKYFALSQKTLTTLQSWGLDLEISYGKIEQLILGKSTAQGFSFRSEENSFLGLNIDHCDLQKQISEKLSPLVRHCSDLVQKVSRAQSGGYILEGSSGNNFYAQRLVAADGMNSFVRRSLSPRWDFIKKSTACASISVIDHPFQSRQTAYQLAHDSLIVALLPHKDPLKFYRVITGPEHSFKAYSFLKTIPLWNYQVSLDQIKDCAYVGWAGQSWDPNTAVGINQSVWEIQEILDLWKRSFSPKDMISWRKKIMDRRHMVSHITYLNRQGLGAIRLLSSSFIRSQIEPFVGQSLKTQPALCPAVLI